MSNRHRAHKRAQRCIPHADDLRDWKTIGVVVISSSLLVWVSILALRAGA